MLYLLLKLIFKTAITIFFRHIKVQNRHLIPEEGPLLVASNHPNTFMDPIIIASLFKQPVFFIAKSTVFSSPLNKWLLSKMNLIPIYRQQDGVAASPEANEATFRKCYEYLNRGKTLLIFPEGTSINERKLRPLKTGTARMALGAEAGANFKLGVKILPVGLNYAEEARFRSDVVVNIAPALVAAEYRVQYEQDSMAAARMLTEELRIALEKQLVVLADKEEDELIRNVELLFKDKLITDNRLVDPAHKAKDYQLTQTLVESLAYFKVHHPEEVKQLNARLRHYRQNLKRLNIRDKALQTNKRSSLVGETLKTMLYLLLGLPVYVFGLLTNYLPYKIPAFVADKLTEDEEFMAPIMMTVGIFSFPIFYALETWLVYALTGSWAVSLLFLLALPVAGFFVLRYYDTLTHTISRFTLFTLFFRRSSLVASLAHERSDIMHLLEEARKMYLAREKQPVASQPTGTV